MSVDEFAPSAVADPRPDPPEDEVVVWNGLVSGRVPHSVSERAAREACGEVRTIRRQKVRYLDNHRNTEARVTTLSREGSEVDLAALFKALADPNRLAIFELVRKRGGGVHTLEEAENSISKIAREFDLSLSTVSHHLKELRNAGLIHCEKQGQTVYCSPVPEALDAIAGFLGEERE